ncbi:MAG: RloB domain-containing protein [Vampirovibrio sp.]|nr:RloB domain-containing protein [Vampirovibrio sp.]
MVKQQKTPVKQSFVMLCEGKETEINYINRVLFNGYGGKQPVFNRSSTGEKALGKLFDFRGPDTVKRGQGGRTRALIEKALLEAEADTQTLVWCFVDGDTLIKDKIMTPERIARIKRWSNLKVCITTPCIEYWFLLHVHYTTRHFIDCDAVALNKVKGFEKYQKNAPEEIDLLYEEQAWKKAVKHANQLQNHYKVEVVTDPSFNSTNPFTAFHYFIEFLTEQSALS